MTHRQHEIEIIVTQFLNLNLTLNHNLPAPSGPRCRLRVNQTKLNQIKPKNIPPLDCCSRIQQARHRGSLSLQRTLGEGERTIRKFNGLSTGKNSLPINKLHKESRNYEAKRRFFAPYLCQKKFEHHFRKIIQNCLKSSLESKPGGQNNGPRNQFTSEPKLSIRTIRFVQK